MAKLELENLRKEYTKTNVPVKNLSLQVEDGEFLTLLGPSGCGKSTLLRLIAGLEEPTQGRVLIGNQVMNKISPRERNIAMVFQSYALYPHMSVSHNIATALKLRKIAPDEIQSRVMEVSYKLGLEELLERKPSQLSGGQRQRVALARALVRQPEVFLLDEPLSNLDALLREQVRAELKQLFEQQNRPVVYVTHDQTEAMTLSTKIAVLYDGFVQQLASPGEIYQTPANQFVAGFVGSPRMNLLELKCEKSQAILGKFIIFLPKLTTQIQNVVLGIRPEDISLMPLENAYLVTGKVYLEERLGKEKLISVRIDGSEQTLRALLPAEQIWEGEEMTLRLPIKKIHWFSWNGDSSQFYYQRDRIA